MSNYYNDYSENNETIIEDLIGLKVTNWKLKLADDKRSLYLMGFKDYKVVAYELECFGDCCSSTWIETIYEPNVLSGYTILNAENVALTNELYSDETYDYYNSDVIKYYGFAITTENGKFLIDYRNSSNGYYGGSLNIYKVSVESTDDNYILEDKKVELNNED